jgi:glycosyltransferase involved in cell wall biosynthesis
VDEVITSSDITVVTPTIPPRAGLLQRAIASVAAQTLPAGNISLAVDTERQGAAGTRARALEPVRSAWTAFLDDDDEFLPQHLERLVAHAEETGADFVYSWFDTVPFGRDPFPPEFLTEPWWPDRPRHTTITVMVRTELAQQISFDLQASTPEFANEDWAFILECNRLGKISHLQNEKTWLWHHDSGNTSGLPTRW